MMIEIPDKWTCPGGHVLEREVTAVKQESDICFLLRIINHLAEDMGPRDDLPVMTLPVDLIKEEHLGGKTIAEITKVIHGKFGIHITQREVIRCLTEAQVL